MKYKTYCRLKFIALVIMPAITMFVGTILEVLNVSCCGKVVTIMSAFNTMLGTIIGKLSLNYNNEKMIIDEIKPESTKEAKGMSDEIPKIPEDTPISENQE